MLLYLPPASKCLMLLFMPLVHPGYLQLSVLTLSLGLCLGQAGGARGVDALQPSSSQQMKNGSQGESLEARSTTFPTGSWQEQSGVCRGVLLICLRVPVSAYFPVSFPPGITPKNRAEASNPCCKSAPRGCKLTQQAPADNRQDGLSGMKM